MYSVRVASKHFIHDDAVDVSVVYEHNDEVAKWKDQPTSNKSESGIRREEKNQFPTFVSHTYFWI